MAGLSKTDLKTRCTHLEMSRFLQAAPLTVFGGGEPCGLLFGGSLVETSSEGLLDLDDQFGVIRLVRSNGGIADRMEYDFGSNTPFRGQALYPIRIF